MLHDKYHDAKKSQCVPEPPGKPGTNVQSERQDLSSITLYIAILIQCLSHLLNVTSDESFLNGLVLFFSKHLL